MKKCAPDPKEIVEALLVQGGPRVEDRAALLTEFRQEPELSAAIDCVLVGRLVHQHRALIGGQENLSRLEGILKKLSASPWFPAVYLGPVAAGNESRALVRQGASQRVVTFAADVDPSTLKVGDPVFLSRELNVIMAAAPADFGRCGDICSFERRMDDGRLVVRARDEQHIVHPSSKLAGVVLKPGNLLRWDRDALVAFEPVEQTTNSPHFLESTPSETFGDIGGLGSQITKITQALTLHFQHSDVARRYGLPPVSSLLLYGPAGTGKTLVVRAVANWFARHSPAGRSFFMNVKPNALGSMWHSESERSIRELFRIATETAAAHPGARVIIFFDELDAIGTSRGGSHMRVHDAMLTALLAELDGFKARNNVVVVGATNRRESLDPALLRPGRFGDLELEVPRPNRAGAREIFGKHIAANLPFARNGHGDDFAATRAEIIDAAVSTIFAPNGQNELATITFRDGKKRPVHSSDLISGAVIASIARDAVGRACQRELESGGCGLTWHDVAQAIEQRFESAARVLTPQNCRHHLSGLPHDIDVVNVEPVVRKVTRPQRYVNGS